MNDGFLRTTTSIGSRLLPEQSSTSDKLTTGNRAVAIGFVSYQSSDKTASIEVILLYTPIRTRRIRLLSLSTCQMSSILLAASIAGLVALYLYHVNRAMTKVPEEARLLSPRRWTVEEIKEAYRKAIESPVDVTKSLPPKQHRRYIVVGGSGMSIPSIDPGNC